MEMDVACDVERIEDPVTGMPVAHIAKNHRFSGRTAFAEKDFFWDQLTLSIRGPNSHFIGEKIFKFLKHSFPDA